MMADNHDFVLESRLEMLYALLRRDEKAARTYVDGAFTGLSGANRARAEALVREAIDSRDERGLDEALRQLREQFFPSSAE